MSQKEFESVWLTAKPRKEFSELRLKLQALENRANEEASQLKVFSFQQFEKRMFRQSGNAEDVYYHYLQMIDKLRANNQFGTASNYQLSMKSLQDFLKYQAGKDSKQLKFFEITQEWLLKYESYMINNLGRSRTTVSMYLRALRTIFNVAINEKEISSDFYPFGERKYVIPAVNNIKKALNKEQLKQLYEFNSGTPEQAKAKAFWFLSYSCNGMNIKDIALLKWENIKGDKLVFYRAKTLNTNRGNLKPISIHLTEFALSVIEQYGNVLKDPKAFIFPIINDSLSKEQQHTRIKNFTRFINQNFQKMALEAGIRENISTYWARHSFATMSIRGGASMELIQESLGHGNLKTTMNYFAGFEDEAKKELANKLMEF